MSLKIIIFFLILFCFSAVNYAYAEEPSLDRQSELKHLLLHDCGSCHGMTMKGGLGPALTTDALSNKSEEDLFQIINNGRPGTPMPPWKGILSETDMQWLVATLKKGLDP
jgi:cytochrome c55X